MDQEIIERGRIAKTIAENKEFKKLLEYIKMDAFYQFTIADPSDKDKITATHGEAYAMNLIVKKINTYMSLAKFETDSAARRESE